MNIDFSSPAVQLAAALTGCVLLIAAAAFFIRRGSRRSSSADEPLPYRIRDDFLTDAEFQFYQTLRTYLGSSVTICPKVSLGDIFFAAGENRAGFLNKINRKHVDFLLCDPESMVPVCGVELDDSTHQRPDRMERDRFVDAVYEAAGLPLVHVPLQNGYTPDELNGFLGELVGFEWETCDTREPAVYENPDCAVIPHCPKCGALMVLRIHREGDRRGKRYYGCPNYPKCHTEVELLPKMDLHTK
ncbi:MAG: DUF2726 domain-containing protein [Firmicutes bacterium]|nr:DUF2726 domain-containing protein [Bacillota bacterium]